MTADPHRVFEDAALLLDQALAGDRAAAVETVGTVVGDQGISGALGVAWCLAGTITGDGNPSGLWSLEFPEIDEAQYDARWVARFISAYLNEDEPTAQALVGAAQEDGRLEDCLLTLAGSTVATLHHRER
ncbi:MAG: hypothetical protein HOV71_19525 [Hamadaea sp.]|uniref:hypothetical protein n=1 Tax=Hamadaea sp. NPDC050747 TaxID=3155789 RepID=UPI001824A603|nr:hypothetical protein [Hamadaea sp.]NUR50324.1 hypothetical protein [Hamadaea sp.]NUR72063.1 hypothetical protein [Hamadaea sp.]NUT04760.1 hypothetical protein [Hamadaea sp.]